jgi:hypothetical protein
LFGGPLGVESEEPLAGMTGAVRAGGLFSPLRRATSRSKSLTHTTLDLEGGAFGSCIADRAAVAFRGPGLRWGAAKEANNRRGGTRQNSFMGYLAVANVGRLG